MRSHVQRRRGVWALAVALLALAALGPPLRRCEAGDTVLLKSGTVLEGKVAGNETVSGTRMLKVETEFGQVFVPAAEVKTRKPGEPGDGVFTCERIRVVRIVGSVERHPAGATAWNPVVWRTEYEEIVNVPNAIVQPGDTIRTGPDGTLELMPHKDVWVRIGPSSEVEILKRGAGATLGLLSGDLLQRVQGKPRGEAYSVRTPCTLLGVRGTLFACGVHAREDLRVQEGRVEVAGRGLVLAGQSATWDTASFEVTPMSETQADVFQTRMARLPLDDMACVPAAEYPLGNSGVPEDVEEPIIKSPGASPERVLVRIATFLIDRREVTNGEYADFLFATGRVESSETFVAAWSHEGADRRPVSYVTWDGARAFARWSGKDLPWEAQWEAAARGLEARQHPWGNRHDRRQESLIAGSWPEGGGWLRPAELPSVDAPTFDLSPFGLRAMLSGAPEWCRDWYTVTPWANGQAEGPKSGPGHVVRGMGAGGMRIGSTLLRGYHGRLGTDGAPGFRCVIEPR